MLSKLVYLELNDNFLFLSTLKKQKDIFLLVKSEKIEFKNLEFKNGTLYNPSTLFIQIQKFLKTNKLKNPTVIAYFPTQYIQEDSLRKNLNTFQISLCLCKSGFKIGKIINSLILKTEEQMPFLNYFHKNDLEKSLDFFKPFTQDQQKFSYKWLFFYCTILCGIMLSIITFQFDKNNKLKQLKKQNIEIQTTNKKLEEKIELLHKLKNDNKTLSQKIEKPQQARQQTANLQSILLNITKQTPQNCYLSKIKICKSPQDTSTPNPPATKIKHFILSIEGTSIDPKEITLFLRRLSKIQTISAPSITKIQKVKYLDSNAKKGDKITQNQSFSFQISGQIQKSIH